MRRKSDLHQPKPLAGRVVSALISSSPPSKTRVFPQIASTPPHTLSPLTHHPPHSLIILLACTQPKKTFAFFRQTAPGKKTVFDSCCFLIVRAWAETVNSFSSLVRWENTRGHAVCVPRRREISPGVFVQKQHVLSNCNVQAMLRVPCIAGDTSKVTNYRPIIMFPG